MELLFDPSESDVKPSALPELAAASEIVLDPFSESDVRPSDRAGACRLPPFTVTLFKHRCFFPSWRLTECALSGFALIQALIDWPCRMIGRHGYAGAPQQDHSGREIALVFPRPCPPYRGVGGTRAVALLILFFFKHQLSTETYSSMAKNKLNCFHAGTPPKKKQSLES